MVSNTPTYYIQPKTEQIIGIHPFKNKIKQTIGWPTYQTDQILQYYQNEKEETFIEVLEMPQKWHIYW